MRSSGFEIARAIATDAAFLPRELQARSPTDIVPVGKAPMKSWIVRASCCFDEPLAAIALAAVVNVAEDRVR